MLAGDCPVATTTVAVAASIPPSRKNCHDQRPPCPRVVHNTATVDTISTLNFQLGAKIAPGTTGAAQSAVPVLVRTPLTSPEAAPVVVAVALPVDRQLTVVTASIPVAEVLAPRGGYTVILLGGRVRGRTLATVDHWVPRMLSEFSLDLAFIGANGISVHSGLTTPEPAVSEVKAAAIRVSRRRIFVGAHTKFRATSFSKFAEVSDFEMLITDTKLSAAHHISEAGGSLRSFKNA